jgi:hypothetical protein
MNVEKVIFLHIAKTGGTSLVDYFRRRLPAGSLLSHGDFYSVTDNPPLCAQTVAEKQFISGHFGFDYVADYLSGAFSFTLLRDPVSRVLSFYKFCLHEDMQNRFVVAQAARDLGLNGFLTSSLDSVVEVLDNQQTWQLASMYRICDRNAGRFSSDDELLEQAKENLSQLSFVGFTECFEDSFSHILAQTGMEPALRVPRQLQTRDPLTIDHLDADVLSRLRQRLQLDVQLYEYAQSRYLSVKT